MNPRRTAIWLGSLFGGLKAADRKLTGSLFSI